MLKNRFGETSSYNNADVQTSHLGTFLSTVFDSAANTTFMSADGNLCCDDYAEYDKQKELFYRYSGLSTEELPYYYYSNTIHPSY